MNCSGADVIRYKDVDVYKSLNKDGDCEDIDCIERDIGVIEYNLIIRYSARKEVKDNGL